MKKATWRLQVTIVNWDSKISKSKWDEIFADNIFHVIVPNLPFSLEKYRDTIDMQNAFSSDF